MPHVSLEPGTIHYTDDGPRDAPVVVLLHGALVDGRLWRKVVPGLAGAHRVIVPDLPLGAHAIALAPHADRTPAGIARLVADLLAALDLRDVTLVGNDSGGALAQLVAADHPERLGRLVLASCDAFENCPPGLFSALMPLARHERLLRLVYATLRWEWTWRLPVTFGWLIRHPMDHGVVRSWVTAIGAGGGTFRDGAEFVRGLDAGVTEAVARRLPRFDRPVLVLWAREDRLFPPAHAPRLAALFADARVVWIEDSYAFVSEDQPAATAEAICTFVAETAVPAAAPTDDVPVGG